MIEWLTIEALEFGLFEGFLSSRSGDLQQDWDLTNMGSAASGDPIEVGTICGTSRIIK